jgi:predicted acylesterase/phospholipase RssA
MKKYGFVASGGGYRSFYTAGVLVWLKQNGIPIVHLTSTSSGNNIVLDYLMWNHATEELPPILTKTLRLGIKDVFQVFSNFLGLRPALMPNGTYLFTVDKDTCRKSLLLNDPERRTALKKNLAAVKWEVMTTNLTKRQSARFNINEILNRIDDASLDRFMDVFLAGITTIPYFKAINMDGDYYLEGGYLDNTPMRALFEDPEVEEIILVDFTDCHYHAQLEKMYDGSSFLMLLNGIGMNVLVSDIELSLPNIGVINQAVRINKLLQATGKDSIELDGKTFYRKPLHVLKPKDLKSMTIALGDSRIQKEYFELGQQEARSLF